MGIVSRNGFFVVIIFELSSILVIRLSQECNNCLQTEKLLHLNIPITYNSVYRKIDTLLDLTNDQCSEFESLFPLTDTFDTHWHSAH